MVEGSLSSRGSVSWSPTLGWQDSLAPYSVCLLLSSLLRPLHIAARNGLASVVQALLSRGATVLAVDEEGGWSQGLSSGG